MATTQQAIAHAWPKIKKIAVLTDFSQNADTALQFAAALARGYKADIVLVHAYIPPSCAYSAPKVKLVYQTLDASRKRWANQLLGKTEATYLRDIKCTALLHEGLPNELLKELGDVDLIFVGTSGATGLKGGPRIDGGDQLSPLHSSCFDGWTQVPLPRVRSHSAQHDSLCHQLLATLEPGSAPTRSRSQENTTPTWFCFTSYTRTMCHSPSIVQWPVPNH